MSDSPPKEGNTTSDGIEESVNAKKTLKKMGTNPELTDEVAVVVNEIEADLKVLFR